jgi:5-formyltetrahydrofolate cyclo-ligase
MKHEVDTTEILKCSFNDQKTVFIPKIIGANAPDMVMFPLENMDEINLFPKSKWGIPEPPIDFVNANIAKNEKRDINGSDRLFGNRQ